MRQPAVADRFYPGAKESLRRTVDGLLVKKVEKKDPALAVIAPHAGYIFSGPLAAKTFSSVTIPPTVILIGPNHRGQGLPVAVSATPWNMPFGTIPIAEKLSARLVELEPQIGIDEHAHENEHSLEVQLPFLQVLQNDLKIVPLLVSHITYESCEKIAKAIAAAISEQNQRVLLVASSDMNHYESRQISSRKDHLAIEHLQKMDPAGLYRTVLDKRISMCGVLPVVISMLASIYQGATTCRLVGYTDSGYVSGDTDQVVGYAGAVIF